MILHSLLALVLVLLNGFFVAAEFAIVKVRASQIELKLRSGNRLAKLAHNIHQNMDAYLSATQLGITLSSLGLGWVGEDVVAKVIISIIHSFSLPISDTLVHKISFPVAFMVITILHIVFGELAPKSIAIQHPVATTLAVVAPLRWFYFLFSPFIWILNKTANLFIRFLGFKPAHDDHIHSTEELKLLIDQGKDSGLIQSAEHDIIKNVFFSSAKTVKQIMVPRLQIEAISLDMSWDTVVQKFIQDGYTRLPVYKDSLENIVGVLFAKDFLKALTHSRFNWKDNIQKPFFVPESKKIIQLLREFQTERQHMAIVLDEFGSTAGLVTFEDILEELVGDIQDEHDKENPLVEALSPSAFRVNTAASIDEANQILPEALPTHAHYDTVAGFLNLIFKRIPQTGDKLTWNGYDIVILKANKRKAEWVKLIHRPTPSIKE